MYQFNIQEDRPSRPRPSYLRHNPSNPSLPIIEEKEFDGEVRIESLPVPNYPLPAETIKPIMDEKYIRFTETPSSDMPIPDRETQNDKYGYPLLPQPLNDPNDPLTWSKAVKTKILIQISLLSFLSLFTAFAIVSLNDSS